jgi:hypothetical protein
MAKLNLKNGNPRADIGAHELADHEQDIIAAWGAIVNVMDDDTRERVHDEIAPCTEIEFLARYLALSTENLVVG